MARNPGKPRKRVTTQQAQKIFEGHGFNVRASDLAIYIDRGLPTGARNFYMPKRPRTVSIEVVEAMIRNLRAGKPSTAGFKLAKRTWRDELQRTRPRRK